MYPTALYNKKTGVYYIMLANELVFAYNGVSQTRDYKTLLPSIDNAQKVSLPQPSQKITTRSKTIEIYKEKLHP
jgi:hypothetical protein